MSGATETKPGGGSSVFWLVYGQVMAIAGSVSLLALVEHFIDLGLKGVIEQAVKVWTDGVRPLVGYPLQWLADWLPTAWRFDVPAIAKDYFGVGIVTLSSAVRTRTQMDGVMYAKWHEIFLLLLPTLFGWPYVLVWAVWSTVAEKWEGDLLAGNLLFLAPLIYGVLILAANAWLPG